MQFLSDIITYFRRIVKTNTNEELSDNLIIDHINRFYINDVDARMQLFDLKTKYQFQTTPGVDQYNMPLYNVQSETPNNPSSQDIGMYPVYQGFTGNVLINGIPVSFETRRENFFGYWSSYVQNLQCSAIGTGVLNDTYVIRMPILPNADFDHFPLNPPYNAILRGHVDITGIMATGVNVDPPLSILLDPSDPSLGTSINPLIPSTSILPSVYITTTDNTGANVVISDSGQFLVDHLNHGLLMIPGKAPFGNQPLLGGYSETLNTIHYTTGFARVVIPGTIPLGRNINAQCSFFQTGLPRAVLYYNNTITLRAPPAIQYLVELDAYLSPCAFFSTAAAIPFGYMAEYIARGAARKMLADTGDVEQFQFQEQFFREQEMLVWKRSQRQFTSTRTQTIYSQGNPMGMNGYGNSGGNGI